MNWKMFEYDPACDIFKLCVFVKHDTSGMPAIVLRLTSELVSVIHS